MYSIDISSLHEPDTIKTTDKIEYTINFYGGKTPIYLLYFFE